ncbi:SRPBCC domain-containing protein [Streptosporangium sp. NPDC051023]|uniref:SRPBCC family protein n=1 Tax=Streptosporangium sp. NPDC051023 TaxID=3155410 RepID=UPI00344DE949
MAMRFEHEFTVPVPVEQVWPVLLDAERVAPCLPGAALETVRDDDLTGQMKVKVGPITLTYRGRATFEDVDKEARTLTINASGKESRGSGTASATVAARLRPEGPGDSATRVTVETSFTVTGRPAQFGRGVMAEVGARLIERFAANLSELLKGPGAEPAAPPGDVSVSPPQAPSPETWAGETAGPSPSPEEPKGPVDREGLASPEGGERVTAPSLDDRGKASEQEPPHRHLTAVPSTRETATIEEARGRDTHPAGTSRTSRTPDEEALDLLEVAGIPILKRAAPLVGALAGLVLAGWLIRRALRRRRTTHP